VLIGGTVVTRRPDPEREPSHDATPDQGHRAGRRVPRPHPQVGGNLPAGHLGAARRRDPGQQLQDEVQSLRNAVGGEQSRLGLRPDLTVLGKLGLK
jgi:hypothetical protein